MSNRFAEVVILAEDERSANFLRHYVMRALGKGYRRIRQEISPSGRGDAKQWILGRYPIEVKALRRGHTKTGLVVHLDADNQTVDKRAGQLGSTLKDDGEDARKSDERISHAIPRRHTETWLCALTGVEVDEEQDCKRGHRLPDFDAVLPEAAEALYGLTRPNARPAPLASLATVVPELQRLES